MGGRRPGPQVTRLGRFVQGRRFDRNPLRRATDRVETAVLTVLLLAFLAGAPFVALAAGAWAHGMAARAEFAQQAARREVTAVVLSVTPPPAASGFAWEAQARWKAPDGRTVTGEVPVPFGTVAGGTLQVWTDLNGDLSTAPLVDSQVTDQTIFAEVLGVFSTAAVLTLAGALVSRSLNRRRMTAWDADWQATGPRWTSRA